MNIWRLVFREIMYRRGGFLLGLISVCAAVGCLVGSLVLLKVYDLRTYQILETKRVQTEQLMAVLKDDMRKATLKLGLNLAILAKGQDLAGWYTYDYGTEYMPQNYAGKLANAGILSVRHLLPVLQQKVKWPERKRTVILVGTRGEVPNLHKNPVKPLVHPVPPGMIVLGYELHQSMSINEGDKLKFMGEDFIVYKCRQERGSSDDISVWIDLKQAQQMLDKKGLVNAIIALECMCVNADLSKVRAEINKVLPDTQVYELGKNKILARFETRMKAARVAKISLQQEQKSRLQLRNHRRQFASIMVTIVMITSAVWIGFLAFGNVRTRQSEIGILRAVGYSGSRILMLFILRAAITGLLGGIMGLLAGVAVGKTVTNNLEQLQPDSVTAITIFDPAVFALVLLFAVFLSIVASWIPSLIAAKQDPATILRRE